MNIQENRDNDLAVKPLNLMKAWGVPLLILTSTNFIHMPYWLATLVIAGTFIWMGIGCFINARRCHRRHCYYSSPIFLIGAILVLIFGFGLLRFGQDDLTNIVWGTLFAVLLTFIPERIWGAYRESK